MLKKIIFIAIVFVIFGYQIVSKKNNSNILIIDLVHEKFDNEFYVDQEYYYTTLGLSSFDNDPKYVNYLKKNYKGIPKNDSVGYYGCLKDDSFIFDLNKHGSLSDENLKGIIEGEDIDTLNYSKIKLKSTIIVIIGFYKDKQFMIADANRNKDFGDDTKYEYDIDFRNNPYENINVLNKQPVTEYSYEDCYKGNIQTYNRRFVIYPDKHNPFSINRLDPEKENEYLSILKFRDYWKGEISIDNKEINFYYHGFSNKYGILYVKPKEILYKRNSESFESKYRHKYYSNDMLDDTITILNSRYKIDSINRNISKLYLRKVGEKSHFGNQEGDYINNFEFTDLTNKKLNSKDIIGTKKYTLIEFWGTWCGPCIAMTPKLIDANQKFSKRLNILSIAVDEDKDKVKKYIEKNKIKWKIGYIPKYRNWENKIVKGLKVKFFPTFILLDSKGKIILRGDNETFEEILKNIDNEQ